MRNLLYLLFRFSALLTFILFELFSFYLIINYNKSQGEIWAHSSNLLTGSINQKLQKVEDFVTLQRVNDSLLTENAKLLQTVINYRIFEEKSRFQEFENLPSDTIQPYKLLPAQICSKTINLRNNYLTLDIGSNDEVKPGMGVISENGVIGIVKSVSEKFSTVLMMLNSQSRISCLIKDKNFHGNLIWKSKDVRLMQLQDVPKHANIEIGDKVITSGYSISFPKNIPIGTVTDFNITGGSNSYNIDVRLDDDISNSKYAFVVAFQETAEKIELISTQDE